jgi:single-strand DNA-binding protein
MSSVNKVILVGRIGKDIELKFAPSGVAYVRLSLATTEHWTDQSGKRQDSTEWHQVVIWKKQAENAAKYCGKGSLIYVEGRLQTRSWDDQQTGQKRYSTEIVAEQVKYLSQPREQSPGPESRPRSAGKPLAIPDQMGDQQIPEDIPF